MKSVVAINSHSISNQNSRIQQDLRKRQDFFISRNLTRLLLEKSRKFEGNVISQFASEAKIHI